MFLKSGRARIVRHQRRNAQIRSLNQAAIEVAHTAQRGPIYAARPIYPLSARVHDLEIESLDSEFPETRKMKRERWH